MDILHHAAIGAMGAMGSVAAGQPLVGLAFLIGSVLPDFDILYGIRGKRNYLENHQGLTHSLPFVVASGVVAFAALALAQGFTPGIAAAAGIMAGLTFHIFLDLSNTLGPKIFGPGAGRMSLDAAFFIDLPSWVVTIAGLASTMISGSPLPFMIYLLVMITQLLARAALAAHVRASSGYEIAIPDPFEPWRFALTREMPDGSIELATWRWGKVAPEITIAAPESGDRILAAGSDGVKFMRRFGRKIAIVKVTQSAEGRSLRLRDVAMRRIGANFGEIELLETPEGFLMERTHV